MMEDKTDQPLPQLPARVAESHKGDYGHVFMVGGSCGMAGAIGLAGMAALRSGAGLVTLMVPQSIQSTVASYEPSIMTLGVGTGIVSRGGTTKEADEGSLGSENADAIRSAANRATVVALGPGMGRAAKTVRLIHSLYHQVQQTLVVDADGLNGLAEQPALLKSPSGPRVLTPHPGEFARLMDEQAANSIAGRVEQAARLCSQVGRRSHTSSDQTIVVLKGHRTVICDGQQYAINSTGNPGMATGGTGDCLTGILAALIGQGMSPWEATRLGVYLHGRAGDLAAETLGQVSMIASDLIQYLPQAFKEFTRR